jgi:hypothetical protein
MRQPKLPRAALFLVDFSEFFIRSASIAARLEIIVASFNKRMSSESYILSLGDIKSCPSSRGGVLLPF